VSYVVAHRQIANYSLCILSNSYPSGRLETFSCIGAGDDDIPLVHLLATGQEPFNVLYRLNESTGKLELKPDFACCAPGYEVGNHITRAVLERATFKSEALVSGRCMHERVHQVVVRNLKKMYSVIFHHINKDTGHPKFSGKNWNDVINDFLDDMYKLTEKDAVTVVVDSDEDGNEDPSSATAAPPAAAAGSKRPDTWMPPGLLAFLAFGPFPSGAEIKNVI